MFINQCLRLGVKPSKILTSTPVTNLAQTRTKSHLQISRNSLKTHMPSSNSQTKVLKMVRPRDFHTTVSMRLKEEKNIQPLNKSNSEQSSLTNNEESSLDTKIRRQPIQQVDKQEKESVLPNHDPERITPESRLFEMKAVGLFEKNLKESGANKASFLKTIDKFISKETLYRRGSVELIYAGLNEMKRFGVNRDLTSYKALLQVFPRGKMIPRNVWQVEFMHYPRQQQCAIDLLEQMENNAVIPDDEFGHLLADRFGLAAHAIRKFYRMMYWMPKFKNMNPYPVPFEMPEDPIEIALLMLKRMSVDKETVYNVYKTEEVEESPEEDTFIACAQSPMQQQLIRQHKIDEPLFVEGPYPVYLRYVGQKYFLLRAEPNLTGIKKVKQQQEEDEKDEKLFEWKNFFEEENYSEIKPVLSVHEQDDSTILGLCITGSSSKSSVVTWIRLLEKTNPLLAEIPVLFKLQSHFSELEAIGDNRAVNELVKT